MTPQEVIDEIIRKTLNEDYAPSRSETYLIAAHLRETKAQLSKESRALAFVEELAKEHDPTWAYMNASTYSVPVETSEALSDIFNDARKAQDNYIGIEAKKVLEG